MPGQEVVAAASHFVHTQISQTPDLRVNLDDFGTRTSASFQLSSWRPAAKEGLVEFRALEPPAITTFAASSSHHDHSNTEQLQRLGQQARRVIDDNLDTTGAVLLRNLPLRDAESCEAFVDGLGYTHMRYQPFGGTRQKVGKLDAATNIPSQEILDVHNEMVYNPHPACKIVLICLKPSEHGGESLLASGDAITSATPQHIIHTFEEKGGIKYKRTYFSAKEEKDPAAAAGMGALSESWQQRTGSNDKAGAEAFFHNLGCQTEWSGRNDDTLNAYNVQPAMIKHPRLGTPLWFNLASGGGPLRDGPITFADGSVIEKEFIKPVNEARMAATQVIKLQAGDALVLDNYRYLHGRLPFKGERLLVTVLTSD